MSVSGASATVRRSIYVYILMNIQGARVRNPRAANRAVHIGRKYASEPAPPVDDAVQTTSTHLFLFKKS